MRRSPRLPAVGSVPIHTILRAFEFVRRPRVRRRRQSRVRQHFDPDPLSILIRGGVPVVPGSNAWPIPYLQHAIRYYSATATNSSAPHTETWSRQALLSSGERPQAEQACLVVLLVHCLRQRRRRMDHHRRLRLPRPPLQHRDRVCWVQSPRLACPLPRQGRLLHRRRR